MVFNKIENCLRSFIGLVDERLIPPLCQCLNEKEKLNTAFASDAIFKSDSGSFY